MTPAREFDYDEFLREFRAVCARRGIDPVRGATAYQVVHVVADARRAAYPANRRGAQQGWAHRLWWTNHELWLNSAPYRSETEQEAIWNIFQQAYVIMARLVAQAVRLQRGQLALRDLHQQQRGQARSN
jgi:hypothetical protein